MRIWNFDGFFAGADISDIVPFSTLLSSHISFALCCATKTLYLLHSAYKDPVSDGVQRHKVMMLCKICSVQFMILKERIL